MRKLKILLLVFFGLINSGSYAALVRADNSVTTNANIGNKQCERFTGKTLAFVQKPMLKFHAKRLEKTAAKKTPYNTESMQSCSISDSDDTPTISMFGKISSPYSRIIKKSINI
jgi:hypothetical protein